MAISAFLFILLGARVKNQVVAEVEQQGEQVMQLITQTVRNAQAITTPIQGATSSAMYLDVVEIADDPTVFDMVAGNIRITEDSDGTQKCTVYIAGGYEWRITANRKK